MNRQDEKIIASARKQRALFDELEKALSEELNALDRSSKPSAPQEPKTSVAEDRAHQREAEFVARLEALIAEFALDRKAAHKWLCELEEFYATSD
ncbi:hypothetical protein [Cobetia sp. L2A1]|uniref:hypothetical protein n=1 Tax=Cobetia sp. L2A1 TaxID=2686360 RepID=UPI00131C7380|nr:hypothetical protein [Cobetia sp. L2A1]